MDPSNEVCIPRLPEGLTRVVMEDGTVCLMDSNTLWVPTGMSADLSSHHPHLAEQNLSTPESTTLVLSAQDDPVNQSFSSPMVPSSGYCMDLQQHPMFTDVSPATTPQQPFSQFCQGPDFDSELQQISPEKCSCVLPGLDHPPQKLCQEPFAESWSPAFNTPPSMTQIVPNSSESRLTASNLCQLSRHRKSPPESIPLFEPQPLGSRHIKSKRRLFGNSISKSPVCNAVPEPAFITGRLTENKFGQAMSGNYNTMSDKSSTDGEYAVEYLYLTKVVLRKKERIVPSPNTNYVSCKRKRLHNSSSEILGGKLARVEACDVIDEMELLRAVDSLSAVSWDSPAV